ncbi:MAG: methyltransferase domain-containing protein [Oceanicaulis sp.]
MSGALFSSNHPAADRRAAFAESIAAERDFAAAAEVYAGALELAPGWAAGWYRLGELLEAGGLLTEAAAAWDRAVALDPEDPFGAALKRDLLRERPVSESMPAAFVALLFDQYAPRFESALVDRLNYRGPEQILAALMAAGFARAEHVLDLGCGTGLMGEALRPLCDRLEGVDLSAGMLAEAAAKGVYDRLERGDITALPLTGAHYDLIVAADVFAFVGALEQVVAWCAASLAPGGRLAFTVEAGEAPVMLQESRRFAHSRAYLETLAADAGFGAASIEPCVVRTDRGAPVASWCVVYALDPAGQAREGDGEAALAL